MRLDGAENIAEAETVAKLQHETLFGLWVVWQRIGILRNGLLEDFPVVRFDLTIQRCELIPRQRLCL